LCDSIRPACHCCLTVSFAKENVERSIL
jgi:hypothetical protein